MTEQNSWLSQDFAEANRVLQEQRDERNIYKLASEQQSWLSQPQEDRGMSPEEQMKRPLGYRSKRQYRQESVHGFQDENYRDALKQSQWDDLNQLFGDDQYDPETRSFVISASPEDIESDFKLLQRLERYEEEAREQLSQDQQYKQSEEGCWWPPSTTDTRYMSLRQAREYFLQTGESYGR